MFTFFMNWYTHITRTVLVCVFAEHKFYFRKLFMSYTTSLDLSLKVLSLSGEKKCSVFICWGVKLNIFNFMSAIGRIDACNWVKYIY